MKRIRFRTPAGAVRTGTYHDGEIGFGGRSYSTPEVDVLPPCEPSKIVCVGRNYADHAEEHDSEVPDRPMLFLKPPNTVAGHGDEITLPSRTAQIEHEAELAVIVGEQCYNVAADDAEGVIAGYTCSNDLSNRDEQGREQNWVRGKAFDGAAPLGPVLATPDEVPDDARIRLWVNDECRQDATLDRLAFSIPELIAAITAHITLEPGDVIMTGTPAGVGPLEDGDRVEIEIEGIETLSHTVTVPPAE